jgi:SSS family solute:Na+ symporter/sodium/pantothenate symporter
MSTLDGILVALSSIAANDLYLNVGERRWLRGLSEQERGRAAHRASQMILVGIGVVAFFIALHPPKLLGIFGQVGVYGIVAASTVPILFGIVFRDMRARAVLASAVVGGALHFALYVLGQVALDRGWDLSAAASAWGPLALPLDTSAPQLGFLNPGVTATYGLLASAAIALIALWAGRRSARTTDTTTDTTTDETGDAGAANAADAADATRTTGAATSAA